LAGKANASDLADEVSRAETTGALLIPLTQKAAALGVASLDSGGKVPSAQLPALVVNETYVVSTQTAMLALPANVGDVAVRGDLSETFILSASPASTLGNWQQLLSPTAPVSSVFGRAGAVTMTKADVTATGLDASDVAAVPVGTNPASGVSNSTSGLIVVTHTNVQAALADLDARAALLPVPGSSDAGKVVTVNAGHTGYELDIPGRGGSGALSGCRVYNSANQSIPNDADTALTFDSERFDTNAFHSTATNTSRITIPGMYLVFGGIEFAASATGLRYLYFRLNGSDNIAAYTQPGYSTDDANIQLRDCPIAGVTDLGI
jgi:hypothetical protein